MSRTRLCVLAALGFATTSVAVVVARRAAIGPNGAVPHGPDTWTVTMRVACRSNGDARIVTLGPVDTPRQRVVNESCCGDGFVVTHAGRRAERRTVVWSQGSNALPGPVNLHVEYTVTLPVARTVAVAEPTGDARPNDQENVRGVPGNESDAAEIAATARTLADGLGSSTEVAEALYKFVEREIAGEPGIVGAAVGAVECLRAGAGDAAAKSRLLVALLRNRGITARLVTGLTLTNEVEQLLHTWVEAWVGESWMPMCPFYHHYGQVPRTFLVFGYGDVRVAHGRNVRNLSCAFHVARLPAAAVIPADAPRWQRLLAQLSLYHLPPAEQHLAEILLLLPVAALIVCIFRNVVGLPSFGTFAPALVGMVFHQAQGGAGIAVFLGLILVGWLLRRTLDRFHLLQVPRTAVMLSIVVALLIVVLIAAHQWHISVASAVSLFPVVILTGLIERFWTLDEEDGAGRSLTVLLSTLLVSAAVAVVVGVPWLGAMLLGYPEVLLLVVAAQLLLGRYTGYRLSELVRFRELVSEPPPEVFVVRQALRFRRF